MRVHEFSQKIIIVKLYLFVAMGREQGDICFAYVKAGWSVVLWLFVCLDRATGPKKLQSDLLKLIISFAPPLYSRSRVWAYDPQ
jgi:hypothetical protein